MRIAFSAEFRGVLEQWLTSQIETLVAESKSETDRLKLQKDKLEREQRKLMQAHYADAIPLPLLKDEQERIGKALKSVLREIEMHQAEYA